jgi:sulfur-carrier protein
VQDLHPVPRPRKEDNGNPTQRSVFDALEARYPMLRGTSRDHGTQQRWPFVRVFGW